MVVVHSSLVLRYIFVSLTIIMSYRWSQKGNKTATISRALPYIYNTALELMRGGGGILSARHLN